MTPCKYFDFAIWGGMKCKKWLKNGAQKGFIFYAIIRELYPWWTFYMVNILLLKLKNLYIQYAWISIMKKQNSNQNVQVKKMVMFIKTFDHYHHKFSFYNFFSCPVNCKRIWNWSLARNVIMALLIIAI